jgi:YjbE family integral membrane protein
MHFFYSVARIILIDLALSGDNAVVIGMAAHRLPARQRRQAILIGGVGAIALRIGLTSVAVLLLKTPILQVAGGLLLIWIGFKLLKEEEESHEGLKAATSMREAIFTILLADLVMSADNVLAVAAASEGQIVLLLFGLIFSMVILMWMGNIVADWLNRFFWLSYFGAAVIAWTGALMIFKDPFVLERLEWASGSVPYVCAAVITVGVTAFAHWFHRIRGVEEE